MVLSPPRCDAGERPRRGSGESSGSKDSVLHPGPGGGGGRGPAGGWARRPRGQRRHSPTPRGRKHGWAGLAPGWHSQTPGRKAACPAALPAGRKPWPVRSRAARTGVPHESWSWGPQRDTLEQRQRDQALETGDDYFIHTRAVPSRGPRSPTMPTTAAMRASLGNIGAVTAC